MVRVQNLAAKGTMMEKVELTRRSRVRNQSCPWTPQLHESMHLSFYLIWDGFFLLLLAGENVLMGTVSAQVKKPSRHCPHFSHLPGTCFMPAIVCDHGVLWLKAQLGKGPMADGINNSVSPCG